MAGRSQERSELAEAAIALEASLPVVPSRGGEALIRALFEPLGYEVAVSRLPLDEKFPEWGESMYYRVALKALKPSLRTLFPYNNIDGWLRRAPLYDLPSDEPGIMQYSDWLARWAAFKAS